MDLYPLYLSMTETGQPAPFFTALDAALQADVGHILLTLLAVDGGEVVRIYSSDPDNYPVGGRKPMGDTPWGRHVITGKQPFLAQDRAGLEWAFFDHELIASLGGGCQINIPVIHDSRCIGTLNLTHRAGAYGEPELARAGLYAPILVAAFQQAARA